MDRIEHKAWELMRVRGNRTCETCRNNSSSGCEVSPDKNACIYNDYELWTPNRDVFFKLAERVFRDEG